MTNVASVMQTLFPNLKMLRFTKSWVNEVLLQLCVPRLPGLEVSHGGPDMVLWEPLPTETGLSFRKLTASSMGTG